MDHDRATAPLHAAPRRLIWLVLLGVVVAADVLIYRSHGYAGPAVFFPLVTALLLGARFLSTKTPTALTRTAAVLFALLALLSVRMIWAGSPGQILASAWLMSAVMMAAH